MSNFVYKEKYFGMCPSSRRHICKRYPVEAETLFAGGESGLAAMPFSLYARLRAAEEEAGKDRLRARLVWFLGLQHFFLWGSENCSWPALAS